MINLNFSRLRALCQKSPRLQQITSNDEFARYKKELGAIELNGLESYFYHLVDNGIRVNNNCSSIVAWILGLTDERPTESVTYKGGALPDIDTDFQDDRRSDVLQYLIQTYGSERVAGIGTYGLMWAKKAIRVAGRSLGYELDVVDKIAKLVPESRQGRNWHTDEILSSDANECKAFKDAYDNDPVAKAIINAAIGLDGLYDNRGQHASGYLVSNNPINQVSSLWYESSMDFPVTEFTGNEVEELGFVKVDLLGLNTLTIIKQTIELINNRHNKEIAFYDIPLDDPKVFSLFDTGKLLGIFQLENDGLSGFTKSFKPRSLEDITMITATYRPGPMKFIPDILRIRHGHNWQDYEPAGEKFPLLAEILSDTQGLKEMAPLYSDI